MRRVVIVQPYIPEFRVPFFCLLHDALRRDGVELEVLHGKPVGDQARRDDEAQLTFGREVKVARVSGFGHAIVWKRVSPSLRETDLAIFEFASLASLEAYLPLLRHKPSSIALWGHARAFVGGTHSLDTWLELWQARHADRLFAYTEAGRTHLLSQGIADEKVTVVGNATDTATLTRLRDGLGPPDIAAFCTRWGIEDGPVALAVGSLDGSKRVPFLLEAARTIRQRIPAFQLLVAGAGSDRESVIRAAKASNSVVYLGRADRQMLAVLSRIGSTILNPGRVGLVAVDSFAMEAPIVTTNWRWHAPEFDYLQDGVNAIVTPDNVGAFADAAAGLLLDPLSLSSLQEGCRKSAAQYTIERMTSNFVDGILMTLQQGPAATERAG